MFPYLRTAYRMARAARAPSIGYYDVLWTDHRAWPMDTDVFGELNHGRILTLYEIARWGMMQRMRLVTPFRREKLGFTVAGASVHYRRRIPLMARYRIRTEILGYDDKFVYVDQSMWIGDTACNQLLLRSAFTKNRKLLPPKDAMDLMGVDADDGTLPPWVKNWIEADATRPWPPEH